nr:PREDICTED: putative methyltransferase NSUN6 [Bemisia tabaci]
MRRKFLSAMSLKDLFKNLDDVNAVLPELISADGLNLKDLDWISWYLSAPKFSSVRVNTIAFSPDSVVDQLSEQLEKVATLFNKEPSKVFVHHLLPDCVIISPWKEANLTRRNKEVIVDKFCGLAVLRGSPVFAPGVKGMQPDVREGTEVSVFADASNRCKRGFLREFVDNSKTFVGNGVVKMDRYRLFNEKELPYGIAVEITDTESKVCGVELPENLGILQNLPSIVCGHVLGVNAEDNLTVLDMCAAPGNKATHLATLMKNKGLIIALDKTKKKTHKINKLCAQLGIQNIRTFAFDSRKSIDRFREGVNLSDGPPYAPECFDRVLLDAPCSGLGQRPVFDFDLTQKEIESFPLVQKHLFSVAVQHVRVGGFLVYSTCSITHAENEGLVKWALEKFPQIRLVPAEPIIGKSRTVESGLSEEESKMIQKFGPPSDCTPDTDTIGFFIAKFKKVESVQHP